MNALAGENKLCMQQKYGQKLLDFRNPEAQEYKNILTVNHFANSKGEATLIISNNGVMDKKITKILVSNAEIKNIDISVKSPLMLASTQPDTIEMISYYIKPNEKMTLKTLIKDLDKNSVVTVQYTKLDCDGNTQDAIASVQK
jgi:hypothetical protein